MINKSPVELPLEFNSLLLNTTFACPDPEELEKKTREQADCSIWIQARKQRLTASNFHKVLARKAKVTDKFLENLFSPKAFSAPAVDYGKRHENTAKAQYLKKFPSRHLHKCGLVVNNQFPFLGASPDGKVCDSGHSGIIEIKCPFKSRNSTILEACELQGFCLGATPTVHLKTNHPFYAQVQGQLMITGCDFCDFIVFTQKDLHVQRIAPDMPFMTSMLQTLSVFIKDHARPYFEERLSLD